MTARVFAAQIIGLETNLVEVEVDLGKGLHSFSLVGLPDKAVTEARDRITAAIKNSGFPSPQRGGKKVIVSLAPAELKKEGSAFDLAIALSYLIAAEHLDFEPEGKIFLGELALNGELRPVRGALLIAGFAKDQGLQELYLPSANAREAALVDGLKIFPVRTLNELIAHLGGNKLLTPAPPTKIKPTSMTVELDLADIRGQIAAKRGLEIAASGGHNLAMFGPPGTGKTMLARALAGILPPLDWPEILEVTGIHSVAGLVREPVLWPPVRSPHHTASYVALVGGGATPHPGEITLAHRGVLFLDEFPEFDRSVIEALRGPLEDRMVTIARARGSFSFPANFILVAAMNPCPCGGRGVAGRECICSPGALWRYQRKISGPIIDRLDLWLEVPALDPSDLSPNKSGGKTSASVKERVSAARERQAKRYAAHQKKIRTNSDLGVRELKKYAPLTPAGQNLLNRSAKKLGLSARGYHQIIKIARTIADLAGREQIKDEDLLEALQYRPKNIFP